MSTTTASSHAMGTNEARTPAAPRQRATGSAESECMARAGSIAWLLAIYVGGFGTIALTAAVGLMGR